jgi:hypothetical protein
MRPMRKTLLGFRGCWPTILVYLTNYYAVTLLSLTKSRVHDKSAVRVGVVELERSFFCSYIQVLSQLARPHRAKEGI